MRPRQPQKPKTLRRAMLWGALLAALLGVMGGASLEAARRWAEREAAERLRAEAAERGWVVSWDKLALGYDLRARVEGLAAHGPAGGELRLERADARWSLRALASGRRLPEAVHARGLRVKLDAGALRGLSPAATAGGAQGGAGQAWPRVALEDARVEVEGVPVVGGLALVDARLDGAPDADGGWRLRASARCERGCGEPQALQAELARGANGDLGAWVEPARPFALPLERDGLRVEVLAKRASAQREGGRLRLGLGEARVEQVRAFGWEASLTADELCARFDSLDDLRAQRPSELALRGPVVRAAPLDGGGALAGLGGEGGPTDGALEGLGGGGDKMQRAARLQETLAAALPRLRLLRVEGGSLHAPALGLDLRAIEAGPAEAGGWRVGGAVAQGRAAVVLGAEDGLVVELDGVSLGEVGQHPAVAERLRGVAALRGFGGELGGKLRAVVAPREAEGPGLELRLAGRLTLDGGFLDVDGLTPVPVEGQRLSADLDLAARPSLGPGWRVELREVSLEAPSRGSAQPAQARVVGWVDRLHPAHKPSFSVALQLEEGPCARAVGAIPDAFVSHIKDHLKVEGSFAPVVTAALDLEDPRTLELDVVGFPGTCHVTELGPYSPDFLADRFKLEVREGVSRPGIFVGPKTRDFVPLKRIPEHTRAAMYLTEDARFYDNPGLSLNLIRRAIMLNLEKGRYVYGGSTISQQLVKNLFLTRHKTLSRKLEEAFIVWRMEEVLTKDRILELYINCIEFGPDIYGISRASQYYFGKKPSELTVLEGTFIAALKPAPWQGGWFKKAGRSPDAGFWYDRMSKIMRRMHDHGHLTADELQAAHPYSVPFDDSNL